MNLQKTTKQITYKGIAVSFSDQGKGNAIVLLHGFLENATMWNAITPELLKRNRVISIDLLGHGNTDCYAYVHSMELMADVVAEVLQHLKIRKSIFVGHSMGGYVTLAYAEKHPDNLKGLVLLNSTARADTNDKKTNRDRAIKAVKQNHKAFVKMAISNLFRPKNRVLFAAEIKTLKEQALQMPLQGVVAALEGMKTRDDREVLLNFSPYKKMMIYGKEDPIVSYTNVLSQTNNTNVIVKELPDGHMSHIENQQEVIVALQQFIKNC